MTDLIYRAESQLWFIEKSIWNELEMVPMPSQLLQEDNRKRKETTNKNNLQQTFTNSAHNNDIASN